MMGSHSHYHPKQILHCYSLLFHVLTILVLANPYSEAFSNNRIHTYSYPNNPGYPKISNSHPNPSHYSPPNYSNSISYPISMYPSQTLDNTNEIETLPERKEAANEEESSSSLKSQSNLPRRPGLPNEFPLPTVNYSNVVALIQLANDIADNGTSSSPLPQLSNEQQALVLNTMSELGTLMGIQDIRDWIGLIAMSVITGPIALPLMWLPISLIMTGAFMIPLVLSGGGVNIAEVAKAGLVNFGGGDEGGRKRRKGKNGDEEDESFCMELMSCEMNNVVRKSRWTNWISRRFDITTVHWAGKSEGEEQDGDVGIKGNTTTTITLRDEEDCSKYKCRAIHPIQQLLGNWYSYIFTYQQNNGKNEVAQPSKKKRRKSKISSTSN